jgi:hypothetical protein
MMHRAVPALPHWRVTAKPPEQLTLKRQDIEPRHLGIGIDLAHGDGVLDRRSLVRHRPS